MPCSVGLHPQSNPHRYYTESTDNGAPGSEKSKPLEQSVEDLSKGPPSSLLPQPKSRHLTIKYVGPLGGWQVAG